jgi:hypothetical protein
MRESEVGAIFFSIVLDIIELSEIIENSVTSKLFFSCERRVWVGYTQLHYFLLTD